MRGHSVQLTWRDVVTHAIDLVIGEPQLAVSRVPGMADRVADTVNIDLAAGAVAVHANDAADTQWLVQPQLFFSRHVKRLSKGDIELVVRADGAGAGPMVEGLLLNRNKGLDDAIDGDIRALVEKLDRGKDENTIVLDHIENAVVGNAHAVRDLHLDARREDLDLVCDAVPVAVGDGPGLGLARSHEDHSDTLADRHVPCVGHDGEKVDLEARRHLDLLQVLADLRSHGLVLRNHRYVQAGAGHLEAAHLVDIALPECMTSCCQHAAQDARVNDG